MPTEILLLIAQYHLLIIGVAVGAFAGMAIEQLHSQMRRKAWRKRNPSRWNGKREEISVAVGHWSAPHDQIPSRKLDASEQLRIVMAANFTIQPLLNKSEARVFRELDRVVIAQNPTWQVMAQVSLGEILRCTNAEAYSCINSKRVDLLLMDGNCQPRHAIEYQGNGHHQGTAAARDAIKKEALRRAGIGYHEVVAGLTTPVDLRNLVEKLVDKPDLPNQ